MNNYNIDEALKRYKKIMNFIYTGNIFSISEVDILYVESTLELFSKMEVQ